MKEIKVKPIRFCKRCGQAELKDERYRCLNCGERLKE